MHTDVINFLLNSDIALLFVGIAFFLVAVRRIESMIDSLKSEISSLKDETNTKFERMIERLHGYEMRKRVDHAKLNLTLNKILWNLERNSKKVFDS